MVSVATTMAISIFLLTTVKNVIEQKNNTYTKLDVWLQHADRLGYINLSLLLPVM